MSSVLLSTYLEWGIPEGDFTSEAKPWGRVVPVEVAVVLIKSLQLCICQETTRLSSNVAKSFCPHPSRRALQRSSSSAFFHRYTRNGPWNEDLQVETAIISPTRNPATSTATATWTHPSRVLSRNLQVSGVSLFAVLLRNESLSTPTTNVHPIITTDPPHPTVNPTRKSRRGSSRTTSRRLHL